MSPKQPLTDLFHEVIHDRSLRFVFPSAVAADAWARRIVETGIATAVDKERFIAWDRFKALTLSAERNDRRAVNGAARNMFCAAFLTENAAAAKRGEALVRELIVSEYASDWNSFVSSLCRTLPALDGFFRRLDASGERLDGERYFFDLRLVRQRYSEFLEQNKLFEPAWDRTPFRPTGSRWLLCFPELAEDWDEYEAELCASAEIRIIHVEEIAAPFTAPIAVRERFEDFNGKLLRFVSAKEEIRQIARFAEALIKEAGLAPSDIALSIPNFADYEDRLKLEFRLRDIPIDLRKGRPIPEHPAGRLFSALSACRSTRWSYRALKDLLLDGAYPWKKKRDIDSLMDFGLRFRCVSGFPENGKEIDVWERSFERLRDLSDELRIPVPSIAAFYGKLKRDIRAVVLARSFEDLRTKLIEFKSNQFDEDALSDETNRVFSRVIEELTDLAETEKRLRGIRLDDPYSLFLTHLKSVNYVFQAKEPGVTVYDYRVAAGIAPIAHIILNATQDAAGIQADPAPFLREDRKIRARIAERDLSADFLRAYEVSGSFVLFTAAERGFSGYAVPHHALMGQGFVTTRPISDLNAGRSDPYEIELGKNSDAGPFSFPDGQLAATVTQARGRKIAISLAQQKGEKKTLDARFAPFEEPDIKNALLLRLCESAEDAHVSPTDLNELASCPFSWMLRRGLGIREKETEIETVDARELGTLYHRILERFFLRVAAEDPRFRAEKLTRYVEFLVEEIDAALAERRRQEGSFQESVYEMYKTRILSSLESFLRDVSAELDGQNLLGAELPLRRAYPEYDISLAGKADLAFSSDSGALSIYDFKTGLTPTTASLALNDAGALGDYQMAAYVRLLETGKTDQVSEAAFYSIENREFRTVVSERKKRGSRYGIPCPREEYENILQAVDEAVEAAAATVREAFFPVPPPGRRRPCRECRVSAVCRLPFSGGLHE
ncbi:MAG: PD-(D/E)XK nuclease family protein [Treponemataceae bacterium]